jgi:glycosyltransferase involved in cell wall biosynthesis
MNEAEWRQTYGVSGRENLPLVTLIITSWNYESYLEAALESAAAQDYPALEIIVLDNGSEDNSAALIQSFVRTRPDFHFIKLTKNLGQLGAVHHIFTRHRVNGDFVSFLDSDDFIFPHFISHHIRAHLLLDNGADISSSDTLQVDRHGTIVAGNMPHWWKLPDGDRTGWKDIVVRTHHNQPEQLRLTWASPTTTRWFWHPGTSMVYKRAKFDGLMAMITQPPEVKYALDASAAPFCHMGGGTILLDEPLSGYRVHGANTSVIAPQLQYIDSGRPSFGKSTKKQERWFQKHVKSIAKQAARASQA